MEPLSNLSLYKRTQEFVNYSRQIISGASELDVTRSLAKGVSNLIQFDLLTVYVNHEAAPMLYPMIVEGSIPDKNDYWNWALPADKGIIGNAIKTGKPELVINAHEDPRSVYPDKSKYAAEQLMVFPLMYSGRCWGVLAISRFSGDYFNYHEFEVSEHLASYATVALGKITLERQLQEVKTKGNIIQAFPDTILRIRVVSERVKFFTHGGIETSVPSFFSHDDCINLHDLVIKAIASGSETSYEHIFNDQEGGRQISERFYETRLIPIYSSECLAITRDISGITMNRHPALVGRNTTSAPKRNILAASGETSEKTHHAFAHARVLLAEDNPVNQVSGVKILESWGMAVTLVSNGREALNKIQDQDYDLVIMDIQMPEMDGIEATRFIRNNLDRRKRNIPIIAMTGTLHINSIDIVYAAGVNDHILKPFKPQVLYKKLAGLLTHNTLKIRSATM